VFVAVSAYLAVWAVRSSVQQFTVYNRVSIVQQCLAEYVLETVLFCRSGVETYNPEIELNTYTSNIQPLRDIGVWCFPNATSVIAPIN
jgi:hypothetical protein